MKKLRLSKRLCRVLPAIFALAALAAFVAPASAETILFQDNFSYPTPGTTPGTYPSSGYTTDINAQIDYAGRQSGTLVAASGPITYTQANQGGATVIGYSGAQNGSAQVIQSANGANVTPNMNFNNGKSAGGLIISVDVANWDFTGGYNPTLATISLGLNAAPTNSDPAVITDWDVPHFSYEYGYGPSYWGWGVSVFGAWDSGDAPTSFGGDLGASGVSVLGTGLYHVELVCTDTSGHDDNPFDGMGNTHIAIYINPTVGDTSRGILVTEFTKGDGGYANNYITLGGYHYGAAAQEWDNLTVSQIPEPSTLVLLAMGALSLLWLRRRS
jgi:hypothetical protein